MAGRRRRRQGPQEQKQFSKRRLVLTLCVMVFTLFVDVVLSLCLYGQTNHWWAASWLKRYENVGTGFLDIMNVIFNYHEDTIDVLAFSLVRFAMVPATVILAIWVSRVDDKGGAKVKRTLQMDKNAGVVADISQPLLSPNGGIVMSDRSGANGDNIRDSDVAEALKKDEEILNPLEEERRRNARLHSATIKRSLVLAFLFLMQTASSLYTGIKAVNFEFGNELVQGALLIAIVLLINIQFYLSKRLVDEAVKETGHFLPELHNHPVHFVGKKPCHACDVCSQRIRSDLVLYRCTLCDFDACQVCFERAYKKANVSKEENIVRGDKGAKSEEISNRQYFFRGMALMANQWFLILVGATCLCITQGIGVFTPNLQGSILDSVISHDKSRFLKLVRLFVIVNVTSAIFGGIQGLCINLVARKVAFNTRNKLFESVIYQDIAFFDGMKSGQLTSRLTTDVGAMVNPLRTFMNTLLSNLLMLIGCTVMAFHTSWRLALIAITSLGPVTYLTGLYARWSRTINLEIYQAMADSTATATEAFNNVRTVKSFSTELKEVERYKEGTGGALKNGMKDSWASAVTYFCTNTVELGTSVLILWYGGSVVLSNPERLSVGELITFQLYWSMINNSYQNLNGLVNSFTQAAGGAQRVLSLMDSLPDIDPTSGQKLPNLKGKIRLEDVHFNYQLRPGQKVLQGISLSVEPGSRVALVGKSGEGKSTLIHLLMRFYDPTAGRITFDDVDLRDLNLKALHDQIGIVTQDSQLFGCSVEENISYGCSRPHTFDDIVEAAKLANAHDFIMGFEEHYKTLVGERGVRVSGGQKQRIALARCLLRRPKVILLDEATSALDTESEALVQEAINNLIEKTKCTIILVAHRLSTVINSDKICVVNKGKIVEQGNHDELVQAKGIYASLVRRQTERDTNTIDEKNIGPAQGAGVSQGPSDLIDTLIDQQTEK